MCNRLKATYQEREPRENFPEFPLAFPTHPKEAFPSSANFVYNFHAAESQPSVVVDPEKRYDLKSETSGTVGKIGKIFGAKINCEENRRVQSVRNDCERYFH